MTIKNEGEHSLGHSINWIFMACKGTCAFAMGQY